MISCSTVSNELHIEEQSLQRISDVSSASKNRKKNADTQSSGKKNKSRMHITYTALAIEKW